MGEWDDEPLTFDRSSDAWGSVSAGFEGEVAGAEGGGEAYLELVGAELWVAGMVDLGRFRRVSDFINIVQGYMVLRDGVVLSRTGEASGLAMPELRVVPDRVAVVGQREDDTAQASTETPVFIEKRSQRLSLLTGSLVVDGDVAIQVDGSVMAFVDATDPKFIPMSDVTVRWAGERNVAARFPLALVQRTHVVGVATEGLTTGGGEETMRHLGMRKAQVDPARDAGGAGDDIPRTDFGTSSATAAGWGEQP